MTLGPKARASYIPALVVTVTLALAGPASARPDLPRPTTSVIDLSNIHIGNFGRVAATYFRGGQPKGRDYADLASLGVKTLINLTSDDADTHESVLAKKAGLEYFQIPMTTHEPPSVAQLAEFLKIVNDPANQPVYVHCVGGRHRTGVMTAIYRMTHDGWTPDQAFKEMKHYKFGSDFLHPELKSFVYSYGAQLASAVTSAGAGAGGK